jgi:hypothetical protein
MSMDKMFAKWGGGEVLKRAVSGMLPKNRLRDKRLARLKVFEGPEHPYHRNIVRIAGKIHTTGELAEGRVMKAVEAQTKGSAEIPAPKMQAWMYQHEAKVDRRAFIWRAGSNVQRPGRVDSQAFF